MSLFTAFGDESDGGDQTGPFVFGGFVAPTRDWVDYFTPAWEERVLNRAPSIGSFHMTEIRNQRWQLKNGLTQGDAERKIDEAVSIIAASGSLHLVRTAMDGGHFRNVFGDTKLVRTAPQPGTYQFDPDYIGFLGFARGALEYMHTHCVDVERVDFVIERKERVSHYIPGFLDQLRNWLKANSRLDLLSLVGEVIPGDKEHVPLQAADLAMWHVRRHEAGELDQADRGRLAQMFDGRALTLTGMSNEQITEVSGRLLAKTVPSPFSHAALRAERGYSRHGS